MNFHYQRYLLVLGTFGVAGAIFVAFYSQLANQERNTTLPLGLTLSERSGQLFVDDAMPAAREYGLQRGDAILFVDELGVSTKDRFREAIANKGTGDLISIGIVRNGETITINKRFHGLIETPVAQRQPARPAMEPSRFVQTTQDAPNQETAAPDTVPLSSQDIVSSETFGLHLHEQEGKLVVAKVVPNAAGAAYGVQVNDVLFQVDQTTINSQDDFRQVAGDKSVGDTANVMLIRRDSIVLIAGMALGGDGQQVTAPADFAPVVQPFSSFTEESLADLLDDPFKQFASASETPDEGDLPSVPPAPSIEVIGEFLDDKEIEKLGIPEPLEPEGSEVTRQHAGSTVPQLVGPSLEVEPDVTSPRVQRFSDLAEETKSDLELAADNPVDKAEPPSVPRFHKYSSIRLPKEAPSVEPETNEWTIDTSLLQEAEVPSRENADVAASRATKAETDIGDTNVSPGRGEGSMESKSWLPSDKTPELGNTYEPQPEVQPHSPASQSLGLVQSGPYRSRRLSTDDQAPPHPLARTADAPIRPQFDYRHGTSGQTTPRVTKPASNVLANEDGLPKEWWRAAGSVCCGCGSYGCTGCDSGSDSRLSRLLNWTSRSGLTFGGWSATGYHSQSNDLFNDRPDKVALHQGWLYAERKAESERRFGFRVDVMYGIDGADTQAFGNDLGTWDFFNGFDFGAFSWAIPQLYGEFVIGEWNILAGHFFTKIGYETVTTPDNFFYSHAMTMYNSEPFTHTGVLAERSIGEKAAVFAGWTLGWDTGFDQFGDGSSWLGGFGYQCHDAVKLTFMSTAGNFGARGEDAYSHSIVLETDLTERWLWVVQSDYLRIDSTGEGNVGLNQYLFYTVHDKLDVGARVEWWKGDVLNGYAPHGGVLPAFGSLSYYEATFGVNYRPYERIRLRPEVRVDWSPAADYNETYFGMDAIITF